MLPVGEKVEKVEGQTIIHKQGPDVRARLDQVLEYVVEVEVDGVAHRAISSVGKL